MKEDSIDVVNGRRLPEIGLMHKKISPCSAIVLVQESAADGYCLQIMVKENLTLYELVGGTEIVSDNCSRMGEINNPNRPYFYLHACP